MMRQWEWSPRTMWCNNCETEVAAEVTSDGMIRCGSCGEILSDQTTDTSDDPLRSAQELLDRWSKEPLIEPLTPPPGKEAQHLSDSEQEANEEETQNLDDTPSDDEPMDPEPTAEEFTPEPEPIAEEPELPPEKKPKFRFDAAHLPAPQTPEPEPEAESEEAEPEPVAEDSPDSEIASEEIVHSEPETTPEPVAEQQAEEEDAPDELETAPIAEEQAHFRPRRIDAAQPVAMNSAPHIDIQQLIDERLAQEKKGINWLVLAGQWLSYLGVLGLTAGAALVVYGYFGGHPEMTPKGWMLTTAGQMLLLLGIVTLISGGLEQSNDEVNTRIELLGEQMLRFERETKEQLLRGPKIPAAQYHADAQPEESKTSAENSVDS
ncbi:MAG: hypothetical protein HUJ26_13990 [Planctomycetaceae bacterium]|nr:hypothetical protein [Planctomycetaceae bacterium]